MRNFQPPELDAERAGLAAELVSLNAQVHDRAVALVGAMPVLPELTMQQLRALGHLAKQPGISGHELGDLLNVSAPTASGLVERLVEKGLVERTDDPADRRVRRLQPTEAGLDELRLMDSMFERALGAVVQVLSAEDLALLCRGARAMLTAFDRIDTDA